MSSLPITIIVPVSNLAGALLGFFFLSGGMYGMPPPMDRYGLGMAMGPGAAAAMVCITVRYLVLITCKIL